MIVINTREGFKFGLLYRQLEFTEYLVRYFPEICRKTIALKGDLK